MPLRLLILAFVAGAAWLQTWADLPEMRWAWLLWPTLLAVGLVPGRWLRGALLIGLAVWLGVFYAAWRADLRLADALPALWEGRDARLVGRVAGLPEATERGWRLVLADMRTLTPGARVPRRAQLSYFSQGQPVSALPRAGDCLTVTARLARPRGSLNPGGFDYEGWLLERGIRAQGHVIGDWRVSTACPASIMARIDSLRDAMRARLASALAGKPYAGIVIALAVGDQNAIADDLWTLFRNTGVTHLMSII